MPEPFYHQTISIVESRGEQHYKDINRLSPGVKKQAENQQHTVSQVFGADIIASWDEAKQALLWDDLSIAGLISENTDFYINSDGQIVVVIGKYEAAAGAAGTLEFVIQPAISG